MLYTATPHLLDVGSLQGLMSSTDVVIVEPYLEGTSEAALSAALSDVPHRLLAIGVPNIEHRRYGSTAEHDAAHGLDITGIQARIGKFI